MVRSGSDNHPLSRAKAFWLICAPVLLSLFVRIPDVLGWRPCGIDAACLERENVISMLGAAFPHVLGYPVEVIGGVWAIPFLLVLDAVLAALLWRVLPRRVGWRTVAALLGAWVVLSVLSVEWAAARLVMWTVEAIHAFS